MECVIIVLITFISILILIVYQKQKEIRICNRMRLGYEKKCNTFRIKYTILSKLEDNDQIRTKVKQLEKPIYIYGGGVHGERFLKILKKDENIEILRVLEKNELEEQIGKTDVINIGAIVIITPMFDYDNIVKLLLNFTSRENIIGIDELLE